MPPRTSPPAAADTGARTARTKPGGPASGQRESGKHDGAGRASGQRDLAKHEGGKNVGKRDSGVRDARRSKDADAAGGRSERGGRGTRDEQDRAGERPGTYQV